MTAPTIARPAHWTREEMYAALARAMAEAGLPAPHNTSLLGERASLWFEVYRVDHVVQWATYLRSAGVDLDEAGTGRVYPADVDFRVYRAETSGTWSGWLVSLQCRVPEGQS